MGVNVFDLQLLVGRENIMGDKPRICIESFETCGKNLYIGTNDCFMYHFVLQTHEIENSERQRYSVKHQGKKYIGMKKPITQIKSAAALNHLLINCDNTLVLLSMLDFSVATAVSGKIKNLSKFCVNERPLNRNPFCVEICVAFSKRKSLQIYQVDHDRIIPMHEVSLPDHPKNLCMDGTYICVGTTSAYFMVNFENTSRQELFSLEDHSKNPLMINRVSSSEFVITATSGLGVFVSADGTSNRPPLQWSEGVFSSALTYPYIVALDDEFITVHSLLDQQQKQSLAFQGGAQISPCDDGMVVVCTAKDVFILTPVALQSQLDTLIAEKQVDEAISLMKISKRKLHPEKYSLMLKRVYCMSGFARFQDLEFDSALELFTAGCMDPRELISLFPKLLPETSDFKRTLPPLHEIADVKNMCKNDKAQIFSCREFLALYLEMVCSDLIGSPSANRTSNSKFAFEEMDANVLNDVKVDVFYSMVILLAQLGKTEDLQQHIQLDSKSDSMLNRISLNDRYLSDLIAGLESCGCYHVCALLHLSLGDVENAMQVWKSVVLQQREDSSFPGILFVAENLAKHCQDVQLLWKNAEWILSQDQHAGVQIFTSQHMQDVQPDDVVNFLHKYPDAVMEYLHHLVLVQHVQKEKFHTHLSVLYLEKVLMLKSQQLNNCDDSDEMCVARKKLQDVLLQSDLYRVHLILGKAEEADLFPEQVILHSKLGEHNKALGILVHKVKDPKAAKEYCIDHSENDNNSRRQMLFNLLTVYLQDISVTNTSAASSAAVIDLLNQYSEDFQPENVLHLLPNHWAISILSQFLHDSLREPLHDLRNKMIEYKLSKAQVSHLQQKQANLHSKPIYIPEGKICEVCNRQFNDSVFLRYPNGVVIHTHCTKDPHICPVTGKVFKTKVPESNKL